jgi:hypothetical protein
LGARRIWDGQAFSLWRIDGPHWTVVADLRNPNDVEANGIWLGPKTDFLIVTGTGGLGTFNPTVSPGPLDRGLSPVNIALRRRTLPAAVKLCCSGPKPASSRSCHRWSISYHCIEKAANGHSRSNGDSRPMNLHLTEYRVERKSGLSRSLPPDWTLGD